MDVEMNVEDALEHFRKGARGLLLEVLKHIEEKLKLAIGQTHFHY